MGSRDEGELVPKLVWRVKLVAEFESGETTEVEGDAATGCARFPV
jgi:hypothetical protein